MHETAFYSAVIKVYTFLTWHVNYSLIPPQSYRRAHALFSQCPRLHLLSLSNLPSRRSGEQGGAGLGKEKRKPKKGRCLGGARRRVKSPPHPGCQRHCRTGPGRSHHPDEMDNRPPRPHQSCRCCRWRDPTNQTAPAAPPTYRFRRAQNLRFCVFPVYL